MGRIKEYQLIEKLGETAASVVYRAKKPDAGNTVILKMLKSKFPTPSEIARLKHEYDIIGRIACENIIQTLDMFSHEHGFVLVLEDINAVSLNRFLNHHPCLDMAFFLDTGIKIANALGELHRKNIIHCDIKPGNILINSETKLVKLSDFGIATVLFKGSEIPVNPGYFNGTLYYVSPEQTGRMDQMVDHRTDLYSLGATFYKMLTGKAPFESDDPLEIIHSHIAREPVPPNKINPQVPKIISDIVIKLLSKNVEDRYQNAFGLRADLLKCNRAFSSLHSIKRFTLGKKDLSHKFIIPRKIFGRKKERAALMAAFDRVFPSSVLGNKTSKNPKPGQRELVLVKGEPGIGKSTLINAMRVPVAKQNGFFITAKYDPLRGDVPYRAIISAFRTFLRHTLTESDDKLSALREKLLEELYPNARILTDIIPELEMIMGAQRKVTEFDGNESKNRFNGVFAKFVNVITAGEHPLVLFLDDLQWADPASLQLITTMMIQCQGRLLTIGSYRDNEVNASHPLKTAVPEMEKAGIALTRIHLKELSQPDVREMVTDFFKCPALEGIELAGLLYEKTRGNPFFINTFITTLHKNGILKIDSNSRWTWDSDYIRRMNITDNVVDLLSEKMNNLPERVQEVLKTGACMGIRFDLETLSSLLDMAFDDLLLSLDEAMETGFIRLSANRYRFNHDKIRETAYGLIPSNEKTAMHYRIGQTLLAQESLPISPENLFFITDQLNLAQGLIVNAEEKQDLVEMNYQCAIKAKTSAAFISAFHYCKAAINLLDPSCWTTQYHRSRSLYTNAAEAAYLAGETDKMAEYVETVLTHAKTIYDAIAVYETRIHAFTSQGNFTKSVETALDVLKQLNCPIPENPGKIRVGVALLKIKSSLSPKRIEALADLPEVTDTHMLAVFNMLSHLVRVSFITSQNLFAFATIKSALLSLKHGHCKANSANYIGVAILFITVLGDIEAGYKLGRLALKLVDKFGARNLQGRTATIFNMLVAHWKEDTKSLIPEFMKAYYMGMETGDPEYSAQAIFMRDGLSLLSGGNLAALEAQMTGSHAAIQKLNQFQTEALYIAVWRNVLEFMGKDESDTPLAECQMSEEQIKASWQSENAKVFLAIYHVYQLIKSYILGDLPEALARYHILTQYQDSLAGLVTQRDYYYYGALVLLADHGNVSKKGKRAYRKFIAESLGKLKKWSKAAPVNNEHRLKIVLAENARVKGRFNQAQTTFDEAVLLAKKNQFPIEEAMANELAGRFHTSCGRNRMASLYLLDAYGIYSTWGSLPKLQQFQAEWPDLNFSSMVVDGADPREPTIATGTPTHASNRVLDMNTVVKASQTISDEVELGRLLEKMMKITMENAGAQKGFMLLGTRGNLLVEAEATIDRDEIKVLKSIPVNEHQGLCAAMVNYVARSGEILILKDASIEGDFTRNPYVQKNLPKSILCTPIINQGKLIGIIYLENNLSPGAFTRERLELLSILSSQMSISIKNAKFYQDLEDKVKERTQQLNAVNEKLKHLSFMDPLTQVYNRRYLYDFAAEQSQNFLKALTRELHGKNRRHQETLGNVFGVYLLDIDHFKTVNDTYGHQAGDAVLVGISNVLKKMIRSDDILVRWGGEEFLIILQNTHREHADAFPQKVIEAVSQTPFPVLENKTILITCSMGYTQMPFYPCSPELLNLEQTINLSDYALYMAKENGRNRAVRIEPQHAAVDENQKHYLLNLSKNSIFRPDAIRISQLPSSL